MSGQHTIRVLTVDDPPLLRGGISGAIMAQPDMTVVAEAPDGEEAIAGNRKVGRRGRRRRQAGSGNVLHD